MKKPGYVAMSLVFVLFGLAVVAASINLLVLRFMTMWVKYIWKKKVQSVILGLKWNRTITRDDRL